MTGDDERGRRFSEREVGLIIKRATELQQTEPVESERSGGVSLAELEQIAREASIDPSFIRRAATDLDTVSPSRASPLLGAPTVLRFERTINGEVPSTEFELLVLEIQKTLSQHGTPSAIGRSLTWTSMPSMRASRERQITISVTPRGGVTTIRIEERLGNLAAGLFGGLIGGFSAGSLGLILGTLQEAVVVLPIAGAVVAATYAVARGAFSYIGRKRSRELQSLLERLADHVTETAVVPSAALPGHADRGTRITGRT
jgi:hypothetical protein